jgi:hypothetical protein
MVLVMLFQVMLNQQVVSLAVLCHHDHDRRPVLKIFTQQRHPEEFEIIRQARYRQEGVHVQELDIHAKSNRALTETTTVEADHQHHRITVTVRPQPLETCFGSVNVNALCFNTDGPLTQAYDYHVRL